MPQDVVQPLQNYITPFHLWIVASGKARGRDLTLKDKHILIDITWYRNLSDADQRDLCTVLESPAVLRHLGRLGTLILLVKNVNLHVSEDNVRGITLGTHFSKVLMAAFFATRGTDTYERALGGPYLVGGISGISLVEVVRIVVMTADILKLNQKKFQLIIMDERQFFDRIPQKSHPTTGAHVGLGTKEELDIQIRGFSTVIPLGDYETEKYENARGAPQGNVQGCQVRNTCAMPMMHAVNWQSASHSADIVRTNILWYVDDGACYATDEPKRG